MTSPKAPFWQIAVALAIVYVVWGSTYLAIRFALEGYPPLFFPALRFLAAGAYSPEQRVTSDEVEARIAAASPKLKLRRGLIKAQTGIVERRYMSAPASAEAVSTTAVANAYVPARVTIGT